MVSDPAMTVMLLELPGFVDLCFVDEDGLYDVTFCGEEVHTLECGAKMKTAQHAKLGRAVAEAFAISHGWVEA